MHAPLPITILAAVGFATVNGSIVITGRCVDSAVTLGASASSRLKRRSKTSRIIAKSSPGWVSFRLMLNLR